MINYTSGMRTMSRSNFLARAGLIMEVTSCQTGGYELANSITKSTNDPDGSQGISVFKMPCSATVTLPALIMVQVLIMKAGLVEHRSAAC